ncbi:sensor histidine kinase [Arthrobacter roseus]
MVGRVAGGGWRVAGGGRLSPWVDAGRLKDGIEFYLMGLHHRFVRWMGNHRQLVDALFAAALFLTFGLLPYASMGYTLQLPASAGLLIPLTWRRTRPVFAGAAVALVCIVQWATGVEPMPAQFSVLMVVYALAAYGPRWASLGALGLAVLGVVMALTRYSDLLGVSQNPVAFVIIFGFSVSLLLACWAFGDLARNRRLIVQALEDRTRRLEVERQQERDLAAADERSHIAREMHDIIAHSLSVIITQADGARYASAADPNVAPQTLETIAETGRASLREMRRLLGVLRGDEASSTRPLPTLADIPILVETLNSSGLDAQFTLHGQPRRPLPPGAELTAYRVVQESLTNILKHAGPNIHANITQTWTARGLELHADDNGRGAAPDPTSAGPGQGIRGMSERVKLYEGTLTAGPARSGGFSVRAFIPYTEA